MSEKPQIAIIGAGLAGVTLAKQLGAIADVTVFEKARGIGGRMSTRYADPFQFDHGAQYFTARSAAFQTFLKPYIENGTVNEWTPKTVTLEKGEKPYKREWFEPHYVASSKMNMLCKTIAQDLDMRIKIEIATLSQDDLRQWTLTDKDGKQYGPYDWIISAAPSPQAANLLPENFKHHGSIAATKMLGCYSVMLGFDKPLSLNFGAAVVKNSPISWIAVNSDKPNRETDYSLLIQTDNEWSEKHIDDDQDEVKALLLSEIGALLDIDPSTAQYTAMHRWRYALAEADEKADFYIDSDLNLAACGDWCSGGRVEAAFTSANALFDRIKSTL